MVVFICSDCGASVKKTQVEKHVNSCRNCTCLSCIDCGKDFWGEDYKTHIKCITEDEKYGGKGFEAKAHKGDVKQQEWIQKVHEAMDNSKVSAKVREILEQISSYDNVPRKKVKFQNWMKNSLRIQNQILQEQVWEIFTTAIAKEPSNQQQAEKSSEDSQATSEALEVNQGEACAENNKEKKKSKREKKEERQKKGKKEKKDLSLKEDKNGRKLEAESEVNSLESKTKKTNKKQRIKGRDGEVEQNGTQTIECHAQQAGKSLKNKKRKRDNPSEDEPKSKQKKAEVTETEEVKESDEEKQEKFNWKKTISSVLQQSSDQELPVKRLRKKVMSQYYAVCGNSNFKSEEQLLATFNKKISSNPKFRLLKDKVKLVQ
ncbi:cell growth-regulating nucleolar protein isoform X2 [Callorhinchus milii]|uniref:cell growth-regulating nucleolar protein isoform X2 n=1 Tax=Callorhinchus milii TaxID=7868 RepID=UPI001C3F9F9A|nr:cell growth-regulating nucleolar protein isoform X2 [Callorhinchus milii]